VYSMKFLLEMLLYLLLGAIAWFIAIQLMKYTKYDLVWYGFLLISCPIVYWPIYKLKDKDSI